MILNGLNPINVVLRSEVAIKLQCLNLEVTKIISKRTSPSNITFFMVFTIRVVGDINRVVVKL